MREFKKATNEFKETMQIDSDMAEVKKAFYDIKDDVKTAVDPKADQGDKSGSQNKVDGEKGADQKRNECVCCPRDESAPVDEPPANDEGKNTNQKGPVDNA